MKRLYLWHIHIVLKTYSALVCPVLVRYHSYNMVFLTVWFRRTVDLLSTLLPTCSEDFQWWPTQVQSRCTEAGIHTLTVHSTYICMYMYTVHTFIYTCTLYIHLYVHVHCTYIHVHVQCNCYVQDKRQHRNMCLRSFLKSWFINL